MIDYEDVIGGIATEKNLRPRSPVILLFDRKKIYFFHFVVM